MRVWVKHVVTGSSSSLTVGAVERLGRTSQRGAGRTEGSGKQIYQSTDPGGGVKCGCNSSVQSPCPKAPTLSPLPATLLGLQAPPATMQSQAGALRRASSGQAWRRWVQEVAESRRQVKAAVHRARPALWVRHKAYDGSIHAEPTCGPGAPEKASPPPPPLLKIGPKYFPRG